MNHVVRVPVRVRRGPSLTLCRFGLGFALAGLILGGCAFDRGSSRVSVEIHDWYASLDVRVPIRTDGDTRYVEVLYEQDTGDGWTTQLRKTVKIPDKGSGYVEFTAASPEGDHRLTVNPMETWGPGQDLDAVDPVVRYFHIDTTAPSIEDDALTLTPYLDGVEVTGPPYSASQRFQILIDHIEFEDPSGSPVTVYFTADSYGPNEHNDSRGWKDFHDVWGGDGTTQYYEYRYIVIDQAGNRSGVKTVIYESES